MSDAITVTSPAAGTLHNLESRTANIGIIGLGYVGLPLALLFSEEGFPVTGFDIDATKGLCPEFQKLIHRSHSAERDIRRAVAGFLRHRGLFGNFANGGRADLRSDAAERISTNRT